MNAGEELVLAGDLPGDRCLMSAEMKREAYTLVAEVSGLRASIFGGLITAIHGK
jgi:hypothetical protein